MDRPDGSVRVGLSATYLVSIAGQAVLLSIIENVTDQPGDARTLPKGDAIPVEWFGSSPVAGR